MLTTPVVLVMFRRPELTRRVMEVIRRVKPAKLLIVADGPSQERAGEAEQCAAARAVVDEIVDWDCELLKNYSEENLGVRRRFDSGFRWVFEQCEEAIILEDDELPHESFFWFCAEVLERYRDDPRMAVVNGTNFLRGEYQPPFSYYFSRYFHCWGFATWRRFWKTYDSKIARWEELRTTGWLKEISDGNAQEADYHAANFDRVVHGQVQTWDYQVSFAMWAAKALAITPAVNLVSNIGFGEGALHHRDAAANPFANMVTARIENPLRHPAQVSRDVAADRVEYERVIGDWLRAREAPSLLRRALNGMRRRLRPNN